MFTGCTLFKVDERKLGGGVFFIHVHLTSGSVLCVFNPGEKREREPI